MSKLSVNAGAEPTGLGDFLQRTNDAGSLITALFSLDNNVMPDIKSKSPLTKLIFRTQQFGPDNGNMYVGDPIAAGSARVDQCWPILQQNPADFYAFDNEPGRADIEGLTWLCAYNLGEMQRCDELGIKACIGEWSAGMPPISAAESARIIEWFRDRTFEVSDILEAHQTVIDQDEVWNMMRDASIDYISIYTPMLRYAMENGHAFGLHLYSLEGDMVSSLLCMRYRDLYAALPPDARPDLYATEAGPGAGYATGYTGQAYINVVAAWDAEIAKDGYFKCAHLFRLGKGESNMRDVMPLLTDYVIAHSTPIDPPAPDPDREFMNWTNTVTGAIVSTDNPYHFNITADTSLRAMTRPKVIIHECNLSTDGHGSVTGGGSYEHDAEVVAEWKP